MRITTHEPDHKVIDQAVIDTNRDASGRIVVASARTVILDIDKISVTGDPDSPSVLGRRLQGRGNNLFTLTVDDAFPFNYLFAGCLRLGIAHLAYLPAPAV